MTFAETVALVQTLLPGVPVAVIGIFALIIWLHLRAAGSKPMTPDSLSRRLAEIEAKLKELEELCNEIPRLADRVQDIAEIRRQVHILFDWHERGTPQQRRERRDR